MPEWVGVMLVVLYFGSLLVAFAPARKRSAKQSAKRRKSTGANPWADNGDRTIRIQVNDRDVLIVETDIILSQDDLKRISDHYEEALTRGDKRCLLLGPGLWLSGVIHADGRVEIVDRLQQALARDMVSGSDWTGGVAANDQP